VVVAGTAAIGCSAAEILTPAPGTKVNAPR
jgi:hypothetical protein